ncbi:hypothetical protein [Pseudomonas veronii]|uniref:hypothetical protein n=1 Tax=Pseudomonas veronii TaxID=76761 RepID=UPI0021BF1C28|nr:hypothetical protein [Pseudomonas veronii]MCT9824829.1 hypothetical protein [Pseudomonas veronii]
MILQHRWKSRTQKTVTEGKKSTTQNHIVVYGYRLVLTPEKLAPGQFEKSHNVHTQIQLEQIVEGQDGQPNPQSVVKDVAMAVGEPTNLDWSINGEQYQLTLRLISPEPSSSKPVLPVKGGRLHIFDGSLSLLLPHHAT